MSEDCAMGLKPGVLPSAWHILIAGLSQLQNIFPPVVPTDDHIGQGLAAADLFNWSFLNGYRTHQPPGGLVPGRILFAGFASPAAQTPLLGSGS